MLNRKSSTSSLLVPISISIAERSCASCSLVLSSAYAFSSASTLPHLDRMSPTCRKPTSKTSLAPHTMWLPQMVSKTNEVPLIFFAPVSEFSKNTPLCKGSSPGRSMGRAGRIRKANRSCAEAYRPDGTMWLPSLSATMLAPAACSLREFSISATLARRAPSVPAATGQVGGTAQPSSLTSPSMRSVTSWFQSRS